MMKARKRLLLGTLALAALQVPTGWAGAQTLGGDADADTLQEIVITGGRQAQRTAIQDKLKTSVIQDSVSQDDIGRLPDTTVVEAARRIPGVSIDLLTDNTRGRSEVQRASIRGFDAKYNLVTLDGSEIASVDPTALSSGAVTRAFNLNLLPANLVSSIQVMKSVTADRDAQALGGQVDLRTRSAFASPDPLYINLSAFGGLDTSSGDSVAGRSPSKRFSGIVSNRYDLGESRLGLTLSADFQETAGSSNGVTIGVPGASNQNTAGWTYYGANGLSVAGPAQSPYPAVPTRFQAYSFDDTLKHYSISGKAEFESAGGFRSSLFGGHYASDSVETRYENLLTRNPTNQIAGTGAAGTGAPSNLTAVSGSYIANDGEIGVTYQPLRQQTTLANWKNAYDISPDLSLNLDGAYSQAGGHLFRSMIKYAAASKFPAQGVNTPLLGFGYDASQFVPTLALTNPGAWSNASNYGLLYWRPEIHFDERDEVIDIHPSLSWNAGPDAVGFGARVGGRYTRNSVGYAETYTEYDPVSATPFSMAGVQGTKGVAIPSWGVPLSVINRSAATNALKAALAANGAAFVAADESTNDNANGFNFREEVKAGYIQAFVNEAAFKAQAGLRYEETSNAIDSLSQIANGVYQPVDDRSTYHALLPSVIGTYQVTDDLIARAAVTKTVGRPDPSAYGPLAKVGQPSNGRISITLGNPAIKPREGTNYDAALDYSFDGKNSLFSVQYFHKDLKNEFYNRLYSGSYTYNGQTYLASFTQPTNGAQASVDGVELNLQKDNLPFIPEEWGAVGFGVNYTRIWSDFTILDTGGNGRVLHNLVNQPTYIANASVFYTYDRLQLTASYNVQGLTLYQTGAVSWQDTYVLPRHQLDLTARYEVSPHLTLLFEGANLTGEAFRSAMGATRQLVADDYAVGTQLWAGFTYKY